MSIAQGKNGLIKLRGLTTVEKRIFVRFLLLERQRHQVDIDNIDETVAELRVELRKRGS